MAALAQEGAQLLTIVYPVWNVRDYIAASLSSILEADGFGALADLVIVDDGGTDDSMDIARAICGDRPGICILSQENAGLSAARNAGLALARGQWVWFVDSDDLIAPDALRAISTALQSFDPDMVHVDHVRSTGDRHPIPVRAPANQVMTGVDFLKRSIVQQPVQFYVFRQSFMSAHDMAFEHGILHEDSLFTPRALFLAERVVYLPVDAYIYTVRPGSIMTTPQAERSITSMLTVFNLQSRFAAAQAGNPGIAAFERYRAQTVGAIYYYWRRLEPPARARMAPLLPYGAMVEASLRGGRPKNIAALARMRLGR